MQLAAQVLFGLGGLYFASDAATGGAVNAFGK